MEAEDLYRAIQGCRLCAEFLPHEPRPVVHFSAQAKIIIIGQAPGTKVHATGVPWNDPSGDRLRQWLGVDKDQFYDRNVFGITPMGFCYPGRGRSGDLPPRPECAPKWMPLLMELFHQRQLILLIGQYAQKYFLGDRCTKNLTETVRQWPTYLPDYFVLPHPSPRNNLWLRKNPWFEQDALPALKEKIRGMMPASP